MNTRRFLALSRRNTLYILTLAYAACGPSTVAPFAEVDEGFFTNGAVRLHYSLDIPRGVENPPLIILGHSSGRVTIDVNHRYALPLVQRGVAVMRFDKRGVGESDGEYSRRFDNLPVLGSDMAAAVDFIRDDPRIDGSRIGLMGHSQAGWVVPNAAARSSDVAFIILLAGPTVTGHQHNFWDATADDESLSVDELDALLRDFEPPAGDYDPRPDLEALSIPGLWIFGAEDRIIPSRRSAEILGELADSMGKDFTVVTYPGVGHRLDVNYWPDLFAWLDPVLEGGS